MCISLVYGEGAIFPRSGFVFRVVVLSRVPPVFRVGFSDFFAR